MTATQAQLPTIQTRTLPELLRALAQWQSVLNAFMKAAPSGAAPAWIAIGAQNQAPFASGWSNASGGAPAGYLQDANGRVWLRGLVSGGSGTIFNLPSQLAPAHPMTFAVDANGSHASVTVGTNGAVALATGGAMALSLAGISFDLGD